MCKAFESVKHFLCKYVHALWTCFADRPRRTIVLPDIKIIRKCFWSTHVSLPKASGRGASPALTCFVKHHFHIFAKPWDLYLRSSNEAESGEFQKW